MSPILVIEFRDDLIKLAEYLVMTCHVRRQDAANHSLADGFEHFRRLEAEDVGRRILQDVECHGTMMILQWRDVIVPQRQFRPSVDLFHSTKISSFQAGHF